MANATFEDHPTDPDKVILRKKPHLDKGRDYEEGFIDGMQHQMQSSVDKAVNRMAQPEQEPVTWRNAAIRVGEDLCSVGPFGYYNMTAKQWLDWALSVVTVHAPPPKRTWVGLTNEEFKKLIDDAGFTRSDLLMIGACVEQIVELVQAKLKEKNA